MIILFIVIANEVLKCYGIRFCEAFNPVELTRMWEVGLVEAMFEGTIGGVTIKIWRRLRDRFSDTRGRQDVIVNLEDINK